MRDCSREACKLLLSYSKFEELKKYLSLPICVFVAGVIISLVHCPLYEIYFDDREIFRYAGMAISKGQVPYLDFFDHKPPLIYFFNLIDYKLGHWSFWIFDTLLVSCTAYAFSRLCVKSSQVLAIVLPLLFLLIIRNPVLSYGTGMTREYTTVFLLLFFIVLFSETSIKYVKAGILASLIFFMQQDQIVILVPFAVFSISELYKQNPKSALRPILNMLTGAAIIAGPILLYFAICGGLRAFWEDAFLFNFNWYSEKLSPVKNFKLLNNLVSISKVDYIFYSTLILLTTGFVRFRKPRPIIVAAVATILLSFISQYLSGKLSFQLSLEYYALPLAATLPVALYVLFTKTVFADSLKEIHVFTYGAMMAFPLILLLASFIANKPPQNYRGMGDEAEIALLDKARLRDGDVFVAFNANYDFIYNRYKILSPSPWLYLSFWEWFDNWDPENKKMAKIIDDLEQHQTAFIMNFADSNKIKNGTNYQLWNNYLRKTYEPVKLPDSSFSTKLFKKKIRTPL